MPSIKDLIAAIEEESAANGVDTPDTEGKNNAALVAILADLKGDAPPPPENAAEAAVLARKEAELTRKKEAEKKKKKPPYTVVAGKAITCKKGVVAGGDEVKASYFAHKETLDDLVEKGYVIKN